MGWTESISVVKGISVQGWLNSTVNLGLKWRNQRNTQKLSGFSLVQKDKVMTLCRTVYFTAVKISQVCTKHTICAVGKNSCRALTRQGFRNATGGSHDLSPWPVPKTTTSTKMWKILQRKQGANNGGSPQRKQVGPKPACPSFQPSTAER